ncbi:SDR family NAD(P)-dependent oxidoreductase [Sphingomonas sp. YL-JM2C]
MGETWLVTGASSGIGAVYANRLFRRGHKLILVARRADRLRALADAIISEGGEAETLAADLADEADCRMVEKRLTEGVAGLVNNAGFGYFSPFAAGDLDRHVELLRLNAEAPMRLVHAALPAMLARRSGAIVNVGSGIVFRQIPSYASYIGSKAFLTEFTTALAIDYADSGIRFQVAVPGVTRTEFSHVAAGTGYDGLRAARVMEAADFVDAALAGFDQGEVVTVPALPEAASYAAYVDARAAVGQHVTAAKPADRYRIGGEW